MAVAGADVGRGKTSGDTVSENGVPSHSAAATATGALPTTARMPIMINSDRGHAIMGHGWGVWRLHVPQTRVATVFATQQQLALSAGQPELTQFVSACHLITQCGGRRLQPGEEMVANLRGSCLKRHGRRTAAAIANAGNSKPLTTTPQRSNQRDQDTGPGAAQWVAQSHSTCHTQNTHTQAHTSTRYALSAKVGVHQLQGTNAPPLTLTMSPDKPRSLVFANPTTANASFSSHRSTLSADQPARASAWTTMAAAREAPHST